MAGITVTIDDHEVRAALKRLAAVTGDLKPVFRDIGEALLLSTRERFEQHKAPDGETWQELSDNYLAEKPYNQDKILVLDGHLMDSIHYAAYEKLLTLRTVRTMANGMIIGEFGRGSVRSLQIPRTFNHTHIIHDKRWSSFLITNTAIVF